MFSWFRGAPSGERIICSASKEREEQGQEDAQENRGGERKVEGKVAAAHRDVAGETEKRHTKHDQQSETCDHQADNDE